MEGNHSIDQYDARMTKLKNEIRNLREQLYNEQLTTKCYQLKIHRTTDHDFSVFVEHFYERELLPVLHDFKRIEDQWRTLDLLDIVQNVNPQPKWEFSGLKQNVTFPATTKFTNFRWLVILCCIFENLMRSLGWKAGDTLDIEEDICDVVGKLILGVTDQDRSSVLDCVRSAILNIRASASERGDNKLRALLITKKKYNGLNLACILLEQIIMDNKDNNVSWMKTVCAQFIDLVVQLLIKPEYQKEVCGNLTHLLKLEPKWKVADVYNRMRDSILMFQYQQEYLPLYLNKIQNFAVPPNLHNLTTKNKSHVQLRSILYCRDENSLRCLNYEAYAEESDESLEQVLSEMNDGEIGRAEKDSIRKNCKNLPFKTRQVHA